MNFWYSNSVLQRIPLTVEKPWPHQLIQLQFTNSRKKFLHHMISQENIGHIKMDFSFQCFDFWCFLKLSSMVIPLWRKKKPPTITWISMCGPFHGINARHDPILGVICSSLLGWLKLLYQCNEIKSHKEEHESLMYLYTYIEEERKSNH